MALEGLGRAFNEEGANIFACDIEEVGLQSCRSWVLQLRH